MRQGWRVPKRMFQGSGVLCVLSGVMWCVMSVVWCVMQCVMTKDTMGIDNSRRHSD